MADHLDFEPDLLGEAKVRPRLERPRDTLDGCIGCGCLSLERGALYNLDDRAAGGEGGGLRWGIGVRESDLAGVELQSNLLFPRRLSESRAIPSAMTERNSNRFGAEPESKVGPSIVQARSEAPGLRTCFMPPIPQLDEAATLLSHAVDALLGGDIDKACALLREADIPAVQQFTRRIQGPNDPEIHQYRKLAGAPPVLGKKEREKFRNLGLADQRAVFERDGWRCRFCEIRVIWPRVHIELKKRLPAGALRWGPKAIDRHAAFDAMTASLDHVLPHSRGGDNSEWNLVTACQSCQYGRNNATLEEVGFSDPRLRRPVLGDWDGLIRVCDR